MEIEIFTLCDYAAENNGKLTIVGTFDTLFAQQYPIVHPSLSIAARLRFAESEIGNYDIRIIMKNEEKEVFKIDGNLKVEKNPKAPISAINMAFNIAQVKLEKTGAYSLSLYMNGEWKTGLSLFAVKI